MAWCSHLPRRLLCVIVRSPPPLALRDPPSPPRALSRRRLQRVGQRAGRGQAADPPPDLRARDGHRGQEAALHA
eukprot:1313666-Prymnesium_polylepis.1